MKWPTRNSSWTASVVDKNSLAHEGLEKTIHFALHMLSSRFQELQKWCHQKSIPESHPAFLDYFHASFPVSAAWWVNRWIGDRWIVRISAVSEGELSASRALEGGEQINRQPFLSIYINLHSVLLHNGSVSSQKLSYTLRVQWLHFNQNISRVN